MYDNRNKMQFIEFKKKFDKYPVFSVQEIEKIYPNWNRMNLRNWQQKRYILKLRNNWYCFTDLDFDESFLFYAANKIYSPSYISLESALYYYGFIPEASFSISSISTLKTERFSNDLGNFVYSSIKRECFFGYELIIHDNITVKMAGMEKAILDFLYMRKDIKSFEDIKSLRLNSLLINEKIDKEKLIDYAYSFNSKILIRKLNLLMRIINA